MDLIFFPLLLSSYDRQIVCYYNIHKLCAIHNVILADMAPDSCTEGSVTVVSDANNSSLQLVEMCSSEGVWSSVCDYDWTMEDATVVCRELGYSSLGTCIMIVYSMGMEV